MEFSPSEGNKTWGFFGGLGDGASVKNLVFDSSCSMTISTSKAGVFGVLAGLVVDATVDNVKCYAVISGGGSSSLDNNKATGRVAIGGVLGWVMASSKNVSVSNLLFGGKIGTADAELSRGSNTGNGANGFMLGGVVGFSSNCGTTATQTLSNIVNDADIYTNAGRVSGVVSSANRYTVLKDCSNNGDVHYSGSGGYRPGNITCIASEGTSFENCVNTGDLIAPACASAAGIVCLINHDSVKLSGCSSIGATIICTGVDLDNNKVTYAGMLYGACNKMATFSACSVNGKIGKTSDNLLTLTEDNYFPYVGQANTSNTGINNTNITFAK